MQFLELDKRQYERQNADIFDVDMFSISDSNLNFNSKSPILFSVQQRLNVPIFKPVKTNWRQLRTLQSRKVQLTLRNQFYERLLAQEAYPEWSATIFPPMPLLNSEESVEALVGFRKKTGRSKPENVSRLTTQRIRKIG